MSRARVAVVVFLVATFAGLYFAAQAHWNPVLRAPVPHALLVNLVYYWLWALATPLIIAAARRFRFESGRWTRSLAAHALLSVIVAACQVVAAETILKVPDVRYELSFLGQLGFAFLVNFQSSLPTYWLILFAYLTFDYYVKYRDREVRSAQLTSELSRAQLQALRMQLAPHFLFNTLNSIASLMYTNVDAAERMVVRLSEFLRLTLDRDIGQEVPLEREIDFVRRYLEIEKVRFEERLNVSFDISSDSRDALVPALVLQPLIENAIHHGIAARRDGGSIAVRAARRDGELLIRVADDGVGGDEGERRERIGLANTRARLERLYGSAHSLQLTTLLSGGAVVDMTIPYHTEPVSW